MHKRAVNEELYFHSLDDPHLKHLIRHYSLTTQFHPIYKEDLDQDSPLLDYLKNKNIEYEKPEFVFQKRGESEDRKENLK